MKTYSELFPFRFAKARKMANLPLRELSAQVGVSHTLLNRYEKGLALPSSAVLIKLANALGVSVDFFFRDDKVCLECVQFRKKTALSKKEFSAIEERARDFFSKYLEIEEIEGYKRNSFEQKKAHADKSPEDWAMWLREEWNLGDDPIQNLQQLLENKGVYVFEVDLCSDKFDAFSAYIDRRAFLVVSSNLNKNLTRKRFTLAHELGHLLVAHESCVSVREQEAFANRFAGAFLMPKETFSKMFGWRRSRMLLRDFFPIKSYFGTSIAAIVRRAHDLELVDDRFYKSFNVVSAQRGWKKNEPGEYVGEEFVSRYGRLVRKAVCENEISLSKGAEMLGVSLANLKGDFANGAVA